MSVKVKISVIGGGASGCFAAVLLKRAVGDAAEVVLYEASGRLMTKLGRTGGGRCNITNSSLPSVRLSSVYPRGYNLMKRALAVFSAEDTQEWFRCEGLTFHVEDGGRVFPDTESAADVVAVLERALDRAGVVVKLNSRIDDIASLNSDVTLLCCGGLPESLAGSLSVAGVKLVPRVPSLFTLKLDEPGIRALAGLSVKGVTLGISGTNIRASGDLLLTDWGVSGPATLKLSSYAARHLAEGGYRAELLVNWLSAGEAETAAVLDGIAAEHPRRLVHGEGPAGIPSRLWRFLAQKADIRDGATWAETGRKGFNRLVSVLTCSDFKISGKASFKEEFVTCGGVDLSGVSLKTLESKACSGLFFAGEALDVDAVTGGYNLQAAWSTAFMAAKGIEEWIRNFWKGSNASV